MRFEERELRVEELETIWGETSDGQTTRLQIDSVACDVSFTYGE